ncbi:MAG: RrF2 family transcriptional regulator [Candidatus Rifleibacteriota bacterium]
MISQTSIHAIRAMMYLAAQKENQPIGAALIATAIEAPANYLGKTLQILTLNGLLNSQRGLGGGVKLAREADQISLYDIVEPIEHVSRQSRCFMNRLCCGPEPCRFHERWAGIHRDYCDFLKSISLKQIVEQNQVDSRNFKMPGIRKD